MGCDSPGATHHAACDRWEAAMSAEIARLTRERDEAREALADAGTLMDRTIAMSYCTSAEMPEKDHTHALPSAMLGVIRERDEARERAASLSRELLTAIRARDSYRASAELRVGMRREFEELLNVGDTTAPETFEAGLVRLRALVAAESRAADEKRQRTEAITRICGAFGITSALQLVAIAERDDETTLDLVVKLINRVHAAKKAAESRAARLAKAGAEFASQYGASAFDCRYDNSCDDSGREPRCEPCELRAAIAAEEGK